MITPTFLPEIYFVKSQNNLIIYRNKDLPILPSTVLDALEQFKDQIDSKTTLYTLFHDDAYQITGFKILLPGVDLTTKLPSNN